MMRSRFFLLICVLLCAVSGAKAVPASRQPFAFLQPDGRQVTLQLHGDEHVHWTSTTDGSIVVRQSDAYYVADITDDGQLLPTTLLAHEATQQSAAEAAQRIAQRERHALFFGAARRQQANALRRASVTGSQYLPHHGEPRVLVILAQFSDRAFKLADPLASFTQYFKSDTQENLGNNEQRNFSSVQGYFKSSSHGAFVPQFDIVGPVTLPETLEYYGKNSGSVTDVNFSDFCRHAIQAVDADVNFHNYDNNGDGQAELVCIVYAGCGENFAGNPAETIWPKCGYRGISTDDGATVGYINCNSELLRDAATPDINGIGVFVHEFSHGLGLPDTYAVDQKAWAHNQSPEFYDLMDYGEYANSTYAPVPYMAWEQEAMGWIDVTPLTHTQTIGSLAPVISGGKAFKFGNGANAEEWMYVENVQPRDAETGTPGFVYGHGLLVYHVAYASSTVSMNDRPNNTQGHPRVAVVPADGLVISGYLYGSGTEYTQDDYIASLRGDPFPGTGNVTQLTAAQQLPNYVYYNGDATPEAALLNIHEDTSQRTVTFTYDDGTPAAIRTVAADSASPSGCYRIDGSRVSGRPIQPGIYISNGQKYVVR